MTKAEGVALIFLVWCVLALVAILHDLKAIGHWPELPMRKRIWYSIKDTGQPMYYVHMFYDECERPWCYCHEQER